MPYFSYLQIFLQGLNKLLSKYCDQIAIILFVYNMLFRMLALAIVDNL